MYKHLGIKQFIDMDYKEMKTIATIEHIHKQTESNTKNRIISQRHEQSCCSYLGSVSA